MIQYGNSIPENTKIAVLELDGMWKSYACEGRKVEAIKALRAMTNPAMGLKDAKDIVEEYYSRVGYYDNMYRDHMNSVFTIKTLNGSISVQKNQYGGYTITETTARVCTEAEALQYVYAAGLRGGAPSAH